MRDETSACVRSGGQSPPGSPTASRAAPFADAERARELIAAHFDFIWRVLRRLGVPAPAVDDAAQQVFLVAARKMGDVAPERERSYLFAIALRVAAQDRRTRQRRPEACTAEAGAELPDPAPSADDQLDRSRARAVLDQLLEKLPLEQRTIFVLFEMEEMTTSQIAEFLDIPPGTVASRLRRARELFQEGVNRYRARGVRAGER